MHEKYLYLTPQAIVNPLFEMSVGKLEEDIMVKYYDNLEPYLKLIKDLRFECFVKYVVDKTYSNHALTRQGTQHAKEGDFVMIKDENKYFWVKYGIILKLSKNATKALVKTKKNRNGEWFNIKMLFPLVQSQ